MVSFPDGHPKQPSCESPGQLGVPIAQNFVSTRTRSRRRAKWVIGAAVALLLIAGAAGGLVATNRGPHINWSGPTTASATALQRWWAGAQDDFTDTQNASGEVDQVFLQFRPGPLLAACQHVHQAAEVRLQSHLPSPNPELTAELHAAIKDFHSVAHMCRTVAGGSSHFYDGEFLSSLAEANRHMQAAQDLINKMLIDV
jgi:hypothetical protein